VAYLIKKEAKPAYLETDIKENHGEVSQINELFPFLRTL